ncbi:RHS repeat-associated core domain-containing protein [Leptospira interrogans]|nr:RHS repeat-associated core domain-containing protein [Leptospira interrogans]MBE0302026.1 hypothetical protein [Leptospira interrogans serovar Yeoncheon]
MTEAESPVRAYAKETLQYDANGNLTRQRDNVKDLTKRISIDSQDRITQIQDGNNAVLGSYWYDESGFRIRKSSLEPKNNVFSNVEVLYPSKFFGLEFIESENVISSVNNVYLNGVRIAALNEAGALAYYLTDQVDSVSTVLDDEGNTLSLMQYLPYGETFVQRGDLNFSPKFNSQELDRESGFYFFNARFYDPGIARFTSADTLIDGELDTQGWNRFSYVKGNPIGAKDPTGHLVAGDPLYPGKLLNANPYANAESKEYQGKVSEKAGPKGTEKAAKEYLNGLKDGYSSGKDRTSFGILDVITGGTVKGQKSANEKDKFKNSQSEFYKEGYGKGKTRGAVEGATESALDWLPLFGMAKGGNSKLRNKPPAPLKEAEGRPHSIIEKPGKEGQYTTHNGDGTWKQYRGSGKDHGLIPRPNIKESGKNVTPDGRVFIDKGRVRPVEPWESPK